MAKRTKSERYINKKRKQYINKKINKKNIFKSQQKDIDYKDYINGVKSSKKYIESVNYLSLFASSFDDDSNNNDNNNNNNNTSSSNSNWKYKSNLNTFIKKHILLKDIFNSTSFKHFQLYVTNMAGKDNLIKVCEDIINKINEAEEFNKKEINEDNSTLYKVYSSILKSLLVLEIKPFENNECLIKIIDKLKKRCIILIENN